MPKIVCLLALILAATQQASAQTRIFKCTGEQGQTVFSQQPCGDNAVETTVRSPDTSTGTTDEERATWRRVAESNEVRELRREISRHENRISELQKAREIDMQRLREKGDYGSNSPPGKTYEEGLQPQLDALDSGYQKRIDAEQKKIEQINAQIDALNRGSERR
ncbi:DUF4124 domain-containing protein [Parahaliea mediterranea]|uniref:DUF4124 domain-containing protein n=1 Tax=Parahaliea mediterranea TaxID=651086 RepID=UPI000E2FC7BB|nr:DUF4124 domain-containing protein [Parahaliea mediterranea]